MQHLIPKVYFFFIPKFCEKLIVIWNRSLWSRFSVIRNFGYLKQILIPLGGSNNWESIVYFKQRNSCEDKKSRNLGNKLSQIFLFFFFCQVFLSRTLMIHRTAGKGRWPSFIPLYYFHLFMNIETFICNFACDMTITYF